MADQTINGSLKLDVPGSAAPIKALDITVASFGTVENKQVSDYISARDAGADLDFRVDGFGNIHSTQLRKIEDTIFWILQALQHPAPAGPEQQAKLREISEGFAAATSAMKRR